MATPLSPPSAQPPDLQTTPEIPSGTITILDRFFAEVKQYQPVARPSVAFLNASRQNKLMSFVGRIA
jgi:hypothetical protein